MKRWVYQLERKLGHLCIRDLAMVLSVGQVIVFLTTMMMPDLALPFRLSLSSRSVLSGEIWRLFTFVFIPETFSPFGFLLSVYFLYLVGHTLENTWGDFRFNLYYFIGMLGAIASAFLTGFGTVAYLNLSLFFAFATLYPDFQVLLFFIIPIKMKYLAFFSGIMNIITLIFGDIPSKLAVIFAFLNFLIFFGDDFIKMARREITYYKTRRNWKNGGRW